MLRYRLGVGRESMLHPSLQTAYKVLEGESLTREEATALLDLPGADVLDLASLANKVRLRFAADPHPCSIINAKSGACPEDCRYCAQSENNDAGPEIYPLVEEEIILRSAEAAHANGARCFCIVTSGRGYTRFTPEFEKILAALREVKRRFPDLSAGASLGNLSAETAQALVESGLQTYNHNIQVNPSQYDRLVATTHGAQDRIDTVRHLKRLGVEVCSGGILGLGETPGDRLELAFVLKELEVGVIPLNVLVPIPGTPLADQEPIPMVEVSRAFALFRLVNPTRVIKFAAGRETRCRDFQALIMLSGANGLLTGGYLTTRGRAVSDDERFQEQLRGFDGH